MADWVKRKGWIICSEEHKGSNRYFDVKIGNLPERIYKMQQQGQGGVLPYAMGNHRTAAERTYGTLMQQIIDANPYYADPPNQQQGRTGRRGRVNGGGGGQAAVQQGQQQVPPPNFPQQLRYNDFVFVLQP